jgi:8-oxo-dGTP pyrophosphatase MutT (NUDIX family)
VNRIEIRDEVAAVVAGDEAERRCIEDVLAWVDSGEPLCRVRKPATPDKHLVSYFVLVDLGARAVLLVDHRNAQLWLPTGGHVEPGEHPRATVRREAEEELGLAVEFLSAAGDRPLLVTSSETVGLTAGHTDVSLWYAVEGDAGAGLRFDAEEFRDVRWFGFDEVAATDPATLDPNLGRFLAKLDAVLTP